MGAHLRRRERLTPEPPDADAEPSVTEYPAGYTCEVTVVLLERYVAGTLPRADALAVAEHLEACPPCMERLVIIRFGMADARPLRA